MVAMPRLSMSRYAHIACLVSYTFGAWFNNNNSNTVGLTKDLTINITGITLPYLANSTE
jgi:hypothetical protein